MRRSSKARRQRGSVAVEAALVTPILVLLILGGVHFGKVLMLRHKLAAATDLATRTSAIAKTTNSAQARSVVQTELGASSDLCESLTVTATPRTSLGVDSVEIQTTCTIDRARFSSTLTGFLGPDQLTVRVAMPM